MQVYLWIAEGKTVTEINRQELAYEEAVDVRRQISGISYNKDYVRFTFLFAYNLMYLFLVCVKIVSFSRDVTSSMMLGWLCFLSLQRMTMLAIGLSGDST
jgi:hypothetical protein